MMDENEKEKFMLMAMDQAKIAQAMGEVPIGCVIVHQGQVVGRGYNRRETDQQATAHAEVMAIQEANRQLNRWRLEDCQLFVTLEPCAMCAGAIVLARIPEVYIGALDPKSGMGGSVINLLQQDKLNHRCRVEEGILNQSCGQLLKDFFQDLRRRQKKHNKNHI